MELLLVFLVWVVVKLDKHSKKKAREKAHNEYELNSNLEYLYTWHYFWDTVVPAIYKEAEKRMEENRMYLYDQERFSPTSIYFKEIGEELFDYSPTVYANLLAKQKMMDSGKNVRIPAWMKEGNVRNKWREEAELKPYRSVTDSFPERLPDGIMNHPEIQSLIPAVDDYRRTHYKKLDGELAYHPDLQHAVRCGRYGATLIHADVEEPD